jgi:hypothetical protein
MSGAGAATGSVRLATPNADGRDGADRPADGGAT